MTDKNKETYSIPESDRDGGKFDLANLFKKMKLKKNNPEADKNEFKNKKEVINEYNDSLDNAKAERGGSLAPQQGQSAPEQKVVEKKPEQTIKEKIMTEGDKWKAPKILKTNLIHGEVTTYIDWKKNISIFGVSIFLAVLVMAAIYGGLVFWEKQANEEATQIEDEIRIIGEEINNLEKEIKVVDVFQSKLDKIQALLEQHVYWTNFFAFLEENLLSSIVISGGFSGVNSGEYTFNLIADDYAAVTEQIKILKNNKWVKSVQVTSAKLADQRGQEILAKDTVNFSIAVRLDPKIFNK